MQIYLPIAEMAVNAEVILMLGAFVGLLSGIFGVGGGFLTTPFLIFYGIPPAVAVATQANQLVSAGVSGVISHLRRGNVDMKMGGVMLVGGLLGTFIGVLLFKLLQYLGQIDFVISFLYVILLGTIGGLMLWESMGSITRKKSVMAAFNTMKMPSFFVKLPYKMRFPRSKLYISALVPGGIGFLTGLLVSVLGIGGGFLLVPAMIYILGMPSLLVAGTSLFQIIFTTAFATIMHATTSHTVDIMLAIMLIIGTVVGAQVGVWLGRYVNGAKARIVLAIIVLLVCMQMAGDLFVRPDELFSTVVR